MRDAYIPRPEDKFTFGLWTVGNIGLGLSDPPLEAPATAQRGVSFAVSVRTFGSSSCTRGDGASFLAAAA